MLIGTGIPTAQDIAQIAPPEERMLQGPVAVIECFQEIPCDPCHYACKRGAIREMADINERPVIDYNRCNGCGLCIPKCPGLAITVADMSCGGGRATVKIPYEFLPLPGKGRKVMALNREGRRVCEAEVVHVLNTAAMDMKAKVDEVNKAYLDAFKNGDTASIASLREEGKILTRQNLDAFKFAQQAFLSVFYERPIVPHEAPQENIILAYEIIALLEEGDVDTAVDEYAWMMNNVFEWYAMFFSPEVTAIQDDMFWGADNQDNLYWGTGRNFVKADVEKATRSLTLRYGETGGNFAKEIAIYQDAIEDQTEVLLTLAKAEIEALRELTNMLKL